MIAVPEALPRINPVASTVATELSEELQVPPGGVAEKTVLEPTQTP